MVQFLNDTFTASNGTLVTARSSDSGATLTVHGSYDPTPSASRNFAVQNNAAYPTNGGSIVYFSADAGTVEYDVYADYLYLSDTGSVGIGGRCSTSAATYYYVYYLSGEWVMVKSVAGTLINLAAAPATLVASTTYNLRFELRNAYKRLYVNGVLTLESTDDTIKSAGKVVIRSAGAVTTTTGKHISRIYAHDLVPTSPTNLSDSGTISRTESFTAVRSITPSDNLLVRIVQSYSSQTNQPLYDARILIASETAQVAQMLSRSDGGLISASESRALVGRPLLNDISTVLVGEVFHATTNHPLNLNTDYETEINARAGLIHTMVSKHVKVPHSTIYRHHGIFQGELGSVFYTSGVVGSFTLGVSMLGESTQIDNATKFLVVDTSNIPLLMGAAFVNWDDSYIVVLLSKTIETSLVREFGAVSLTQG